MDWIKIEDHLPAFNEKVLGFDGCRIYICRRNDEDKYNEHWEVCEENDCACNGCTGEITHWMPLPQPPEDNEPPQEA